ncbi:GntR family transcriptional regulator [Kribbella capetownensis]|uniref:GntR family transcriptional regulator n=1 Tax=Kribbella capetownensis TaxID=1572659 RepID=A0A4R0K0E1_9ACTN|nr:GntR family transcriptional regulator [Kribbella capetownensis]TCC53361.1 GntR family transcriptional regulator [Kribbella capetownensis]
MTTRVAEVYEQLRSDILAARLPPGERLKVNPLCARFGVSLSVVREALTRLTEQRLVRSVPQYGFTVATLDRASLVDLTEVRVQLETLALRWAIERADLDWETSVVAALYKLGRTPMYTEDPEPQVSEEWSDAHAALHTALAAGCASPLLLELRRGPYDASEIYRRWAKPRDGEKRDVHAEHTAIVDAAIARDSATAERLLAEHIRRTTETLLSREPSGEDAAAS